MMNLNNMMVPRGVNPQVAMHVKENPPAADFLEEVQKIHITETCALSSKIIFYVTVIAFLIPSAWSIFSMITGSEFPEKMYMDGCYSKNDTSYLLPLDVCFRCCNDRGFVYTHLLTKFIPKSASDARRNAIVYTVIVGLATGPAYAKLTLQEHIAIFLMPFGLTVKSKFSIRQLWPMILFALLFVGVAALTIDAQIQLSRTLLGDAVLGYEDFCDQNAPGGWAGRKLFAKFNDDNPSTQVGQKVGTAFDYIKAFFGIYLLYIPVVIKFYVACSTTYSKLGLDHMAKDNESAAILMECFKWEVEEEDLIDALGELSRSYQNAYTTNGCIEYFHRILVFDCDCKKPSPALFAFDWGTDLVSVQRLFSILLKKQKLIAYRSTLDAFNEGPDGGGGGAGGEMKPMSSGKPVNAANVAPPPSSVPQPQQQQQQQQMMMMQQQQQQRAQQMQMQQQQRPMQQQMMASPQMMMGQRPMQPQPQMMQGGGMMMRQQPQQAAAMMPPPSQHDMDAL